MKQGDIHWIDLPPLVGREQSGRRPGLIVQTDALTPSLTTVMVVPLTSRCASARFPATVLVEPDVRNGLTVPSVALAFQLRAVDKRRVGHRIGTVAPDVFERLMRAVMGLFRAGRTEPDGSES